MTDEEDVLCGHNKRKSESARLVDDPFTFSPINPNWVIIPHEDALMLTLGLTDLTCREF